MEWRSVVFKNIWRNMRRYLGYMLASAMSVAVFAMFFIFIFNRGVKGLASLQLVAVVMVICVVIVAWFAAFFVFFFHASLLRARNKEFGLLLTLGMTPGQIGWFIFFESLCIALVSLLLGMGLGVVATQPFFWAMGIVLGLQDAIPFEVPAVALIITGIFFGVVFVTEAMIVSWRIARRTPRTLLLGARTQQVPVKAAWWKVVLGIACIGGGYTLAIGYSGWFVLNAIPIVLLTIVGTFLLYGQITVFLLQMLRRSALSGSGLLIVARLAYRMRDYARMLAIVTVLNACVLTGMGAVGGFLQTIRTGNVQTNPVDVMLSEQLSAPWKLSEQQIEQKLQQQKIKIKEGFSIPVVVGYVGKVPVSVMAVRDYEQVQQVIGRVHPEMGPVVNMRALSNTQAYVFEPERSMYFDPGAVRLPMEGNELRVRVREESRVWQVERQKGRLINARQEIADTVMVVNEEQFALMQSKASKSEQWRVHGLYFANNQQTLGAIDVLEGVLNKDVAMAMNNIRGTVTVMQLLAALLFAGTFVSLLFLLASGCALYFKIFAQQEEDRRQLRALARVGLRRREALGIIVVEFLLLFFVPVVIAVVHSSVATVDLLRLMGAPLEVGQIVWGVLGVTSAIYAGCFGLYFVVTVVQYFRRVGVVMV